MSASAICAADNETGRLEFASFRNRHAGEAILICGCGGSLELLQPPVALTSIGVNDVGRRFHPTYLVVVNPEGQFSPERFEFVRNSRASAIFTQYGSLPVPAERRVLLRLGQYGSTDFSRADVVHYTQNSPYVAACIAVHMGASRIGLLGVDFGSRSVYGTSSPHPLTAQVNRINAEYANLALACTTRGIELVNLSPTSRLTALPHVTLSEFLRPAVPQEIQPLDAVGFAARSAILVVDYDFLTCGRVFGEGLTRAAASLGARVKTVVWDDPGLPAHVERFKPDLIVVVHGRSFAQRWGERFRSHNTAVWLLDEPYEVDDTARWSSVYRTVFSNDRSTLSRHRNAHYLPVCYDDQTHRDPAVGRQYRVGFVGGANATRERYLAALAAAGLLDYVVGGPWASPLLRRLTLAQKVSPAETTRLYQATQVIVNVFREAHHFNRNRVPATALNPRVLEALACGAAVVSERRPGIGEILPELPQFDSPGELVELVRRCLTDVQHLATLKRQCEARIKGNAYRDRLATMLAVTLPRNDSTRAQTAARNVAGAGRTRAVGVAALPAGWIVSGIELEAGEQASLVFKRPQSLDADGTGVETGLVSERSYANVDLRFTMRFTYDAVLVAKIHQVRQDDPRSNSYHLIATATGSYLASRDQVLLRFALRPDAWIRVRLRWSGCWLEIWTDDALRGRFREDAIASGYCFIGSKGGTIAMHSVSIEECAQPSARVIRLPGAAVADASSTAPAPTQKLNLAPLGGATLRNLIYHVWPKRGSNWRWNIEQLRKRIDLFNGKRIIGIVEDQQTDPATAVMELLAGHGCEFLVRPNDPSGEAITFPAMLQKVASSGEDEVTFYGHAKGVKYGLPCPPNVQRWSEALYRVALDDWPTVRHHLDHLAMTGSFRMPGRFASHRNAGDWHYSGTFFWMRHAAVFARAWQDVQEFYYGVEAWPGGLFRKEETGCLLLDDLRPPLPYVEEFWRRRGNQALRDWEARRRGIEVPPDLASPKPFDGFTAPRLEHRPEEFGWWLEQLKVHAVRRLLVIGATGGGAEWHIARAFRQEGFDIEIATIEPDPTPELETAYEEARQRFGQRVRLLAGSPRDPVIRAQLDDSFEAVFIDGHHGYDQVHADFVLAQSLNPRLIGLHDIVDSDWHATSGCCVSRLWSEIAARHSTLEKSADTWAGIGVVLNRP